MITLEVERKVLVELLRAEMTPTKMGRYVEEQYAWREIYLGHLADTILESLKRPSWKVKP